MGLCGCRILFTKDFQKFLRLQNRSESIVSDKSPESEQDSYSNKYVDEAMSSSV